MPVVSVELDIFSGMPNPTWRLAEPESDGLLRRVAALSPASPVQLSGQLGYRGFIVHVTQGDDTDVIRVQRGTVQILKGGVAAYYRDVDRALERWLLETGRPHLRADILQVVERDLS